MSDMRTVILRGYTMDFLYERTSTDRASYVPRFNYRFLIEDDLGEQYDIEIDNAGDFYRIDNPLQFSMWLSSLSFDDIPRKKEDLATWIDDAIRSYRAQ